MLYELSELDVEVIKCSLKAHLKHCEDFIKFDDKVKTFEKTVTKFIDIKDFDESEVEQ